MGEDLDLFRGENKTKLIEDQSEFRIFRHKFEPLFQEYWSKVMEQAYLKRMDSVDTFKSVVKAFDFIDDSYSDKIS